MQSSCKAFFENKENIGKFFKFNGNEIYCYVAALNSENELEIFKNKFVKFSSFIGISDELKLNIKKELNDGFYGIGSFKKNIENRYSSYLILKTSPPRHLEIRSEFKHDGSPNLEFINHRITLLDNIKNFNDTNFMNEDDPIKELINKYKNYVRENELKDELYKWRLLEQYRGRPYINAEDFTQEFKSIKFQNLIYAVGIGASQHLAKERPEDYRKCFETLFDESKSLMERVAFFNSETLKIYRELVPELKYSHHQDERTIATFLTFHNPNKYAFYKDSFYQKYCKLLGEKAKNKNEKYVHYLELVDNLINNYISKDSELINLVNSFKTADCFEDENFKLLAQDILYQTLEGIQTAEKVIGLVAADTTNWQENYIDTFEGFDAGTVWNSKRPSGTDDTIKQLRELIESEETFNLYYSAQKQAIYKATVIDFVTSQEELALKNWSDKFSNIKDYSPDYSEYIDDNKKASIVFLIKDLIKINPIPISEFKFYKAYSAPIQDNLSPIIHEPINYQMIEETNTENKTIAMKKEHPLNQILFGTPGTGKTYNTINIALDIIGENIEGLSRADVKKLFDEKMDEGQIVFTTFHQSMSYEDFIEGIKPVKQKPEDTFLKYEVQSGIFKLICDKAKSNIDNASEENKRKLSFEEAFEMFQLSWEENTEMKFPLRTEGKDFTITGFTNTSIQFKKASGGTSHTLSISALKAMYYGKEYNFKQGVGIYYPSVLNKLQSFQPSTKEIVKLKNYVFIIDEINRGNVSQIFGELITLIEDDKRIGKSEALKVTLPYSKEEFGVPSNLYIIGTMNTADRSVEALDAALRRRFSFKEMIPNPELLSPLEVLRRFWIANTDKYGETQESYDSYESEIRKLLGAKILDFKKYIKYGEELQIGNVDKTFSKEEFEENLKDLISFDGVDLNKLLRTINNRIEKLIDKDHQIGHSYLLNVYSFDELKAAFSNKIIPLLQEYFFGDYSKIGLVLGGGFVSVSDSTTTNLFAEFEDSVASDYADKVIYKINDIEGLTEEEFKVALNKMQIK